MVDQTAYEEIQGQLQEQVLRIVSSVYTLDKTIAASKLDFPIRDYEHFKKIVNDRYVGNFRGKGYGKQVVGPRILIAGHTNQGKSTLLQAMLRIILGDKSYELMQECNSVHNLNVRYANRISDYEKDHSVEIHYRNSPGSDKFNTFTELNSKKNDLSFIQSVSEITLMPMDVMHRLLSATLLVDAAVATAWKAAFTFDSRFKGDSAKLVIILRTAEEKVKYEKMLGLDTREGISASDAQMLKDMDISLNEYLGIEFDPYPHGGATIQVDRKTLNEWSRDSITTLMRLIVDHKHFIKEIHWIEAPIDDFAYLSGLTLIDSPGYENVKTDPNSAITFEEKDKTVFFNLVSISNNVFHDTTLNDLYSEMFAQDNIIDELLIHRFMYSITAIEYIFNNEGFNLGADVATAHHDIMQKYMHGNIIARVVSQQNSTLNQHVNSTTLAIKESCRFKEGGYPPFVFVSGAIQEMQNKRNIAWSACQSESVVESYKNLPRWENQHVDSTRCNDLQDMIKMLDGFAVLHQVQQINANASWFTYCFFKQAHHDLIKYHQIIDDRVEAFLPNENIGLYLKWSQVLSFSQKENTRLTNAGGIKIQCDVSGIAWDNSLESLCEELRIRLKASTFTLNDNLDASYYADLIDRFGASSISSSYGESVFNNIDEVWGYIVDVFRTSVIRTSLISAQQSKQQVFASAYKEINVICKYFTQVLVLNFKKILQVESALSEVDAIDKERKLMSIISQNFAVDGSESREWIESFYETVSSKSRTEDDKRRVEEAKLLKAKIDELQHELLGLDRNVQKMAQCIN